MYVYDVYVNICDMIHVPRIYRTVLNDELSLRATGFGTAQLMQKKDPRVLQ